MKFVFYALMIPLAFVMGKILYNPFFGGSELATEVSDTVKEIQVKSPMGTVTEIVDFHDIDPKDFPTKVTLAQTVVLTDKNGLSPTKLEPGSPVKPLFLDEMTLEVTSPLAAHLTGKVPVLETDFAEGVAKKRMERRMAMMKVEEAPTPAPPAPPVKEVASNTPSPAVPTMNEPTPAPEAEPEPEPAPEPAAPTSLSAEQIVEAMKASLAGGKIKELDASKVTSWDAGEDESFDGEDFQVGIATYKEMTILGEKTLQAKALFKEGELDKWIHAKTGMEIR